MSKTGQDRFGDCVAYIQTHIDGTLATNLAATAGTHQARLGEELSLGARWDGLASSSAHDANTQKRRALRALLLCQRVYFSDLWPCLLGNVAAVVHHNWLPNDWKDQSLRFWEARSESEIREGIRMFSATSDNPDHVANAAKVGQPSAPMPPALTATRSTFTGQPTPTCYDAVMLWLFKSGLVSLRWLLKNRGANTKETLTNAFGQGWVIWNGNFGATDSLPAVPRGHIVHIFEHEQAWRGHWMVSAGNGGACGCNNNDENPPVPRHYCADLSLDKQFLDYGSGTAVVINPIQIPDRF